MNGCKNCKHWRSFEEIEPNPLPYDDVDDDPIEDRLHDRREVATRRKLGLCVVASEKDRGLDSLAICVDESDCRYDLRTSADFFCNQWTEKE